MEYLTMEVSSQALKYHRTLCTEFAAACFLNIGLDHISPIEHPDFEDYFSSKLKIFSQGAVNCVNLDCDYADRVLEAARAAGQALCSPFLRRIRRRMSTPPRSASGGTTFCSGSAPGAICGNFG